MFPMTESSQQFRILLIDDEPSVLFALKLLLEALGFAVHDYNQPEEAIGFIKNNNLPDLCICDLKMPKMNGLQVLAEVMNIAPSLPFVLMSAHANLEEVQKAEQLGARGFLAKPFTPEQLKKLVQDLQEDSKKSPKN